MLNLKQIKDTHSFDESPYRKYHLSQLIEFSLPIWLFSGITK
jgi:hypothetical protein